MIEQIRNDLKVAMKAGDSFKVSVLRGVLAVIQNSSIEKKAELTDDEIITVIQKESKKTTPVILSSPVFIYCRLVMGIL